MTWQALQGGVLQNLVAALITFLLGLGLGWLGQRILSKRSARQLLSLPDGKVHIVLASPSYLRPGETTSTTNASVPIATIGTIFAYRHIVDLLRRRQPKGKDSLSVYFSAEFPPALLADNLILIGFAKTNLITRDVTKRVPLPVLVDDHIWHDTITTADYAAVIEAGHITEDYGALIRVVNPYNRNSIVYIIAGSQTYGMKAAAEFLNNRNLLEITEAYVPERIYSHIPHFLYPLIAKNGRKRHYEIIVQTHVKSYFTSEATRVCSYPL
jgi:hypothetical protein